jgi:triosephosphate isomerase
MAAEAHRFIRSQARTAFGPEASNGVRILYGGSVKPDIAAGLIAQPEVGGFLVGSTSLDPAGFAFIVNLRTSPAS